MNNLFANAPTVGSHDQTASLDELQMRIQQLEQQQQYNSNGHTKTEESSSKSKWQRFKKGFRKFFKNYVKPILVFLPKFLDSCARMKKAFA